MSMKRVRMEEPELKTWEDVNQALRLIAEAQNEIAMVEAGMNVQIDTIKLTYEEKIREYKKQIKEQELRIKEFTTDKKDQLDGRTKDLTFGKVGFRKSTRLQLPKVLDKVIAALRKNGMQDCIICKETVNKDILKQYDEQLILEVGGSLKVEDAFWYETKQVDLKVG